MPKNGNTDTHDKPFIKHAFSGRDVRRVRFFVVIPRNEKRSSAELNLFSSELNFGVACLKLQQTVKEMLPSSA
jgi:hypothetical protein